MVQITEAFNKHIGNGQRLPSKFLKDTDLAARYGVDRVTIHRWRAGTVGFPQPVKLTPGTTRWLLADIEAWEAQKAAEAAA